MKKRKRRRLTDQCSRCEAPVWQYDTDGKAFCESHARWQHMTIERMRHPLDEYHNRAAVLLPRLTRATQTMVDIIKRIGYAEALWVAEHLGFEWGVQWWDEQLFIKLSDMQLVAFSAAMRAHHEALYPSKDDPTKLRVRGTDASQKQKKKASL